MGIQQTIFMKLENILVRIYKFPEDELREMLNLLGDSLVITFDEETQRYVFQTSEKVNK